MIPRLSLATLFAVLVIGTAAAESWPDIASPPKAKVQWVGDRMRIDGVPTRILQFQSSVSRTEVVEYYRAYWSGGYPTKPSVSPLGAATVVGQRHGPFFMTVKVEDAGGGTSRGLISVAEVAGVEVKRDPGIVPVMPGATVVSVVESDDPGKHSRNVTLIGPQAVTSAIQFYTAEFANAGWHQIQGAGAAGAGSFFVFAKDGSEMQVSVVMGKDKRGSCVMANLVTKDTGPSGR